MQKHQICKGKPKGEKIPAKQVCNLGNSSVKVPLSHVILSYTKLSSPSYTRRQWHYQEHSLGQWQMHQQETERLNVVKMFFHTDLLTDSFFQKFQQALWRKQMRCFHTSQTIMKSLKDTKTTLKNKFRNLEKNRFQSVTTKMIWNCIKIIKTLIQENAI